MTAKIPGAVVSMGGDDWTVPPLTLGLLKRLWPKIQSLELRGTLTERMASFDVIVEIVTAAMQRNYPDVSEQKVEELLDMGNLDDVLIAVLTGSGLKKPGEAPAVAKPDGATFTVSSPPPAGILTP